MKKFLAILIFLVSYQANAGLITIQSDQDTSSIGETVNITITGSGISSFDFFSLDFHFDTSIYSFLPDSLISDLDLLDEVFVGEGLVATPVDKSGVFLNFYQWDEFISAGQDFVLASFQLTAISSGANTFSLGHNFFAGLNGMLNVDSTHKVNTQVLAKVISVPEPTTLIIFSLSILGLITRRLNQSV